MTSRHLDAVTYNHLTSSRRYGILSPVKTIVLKHAIKARNQHHRHVVVVMRGGAIVAISHNHDTIHAEVSALSILWPDQRPGCRVWSFRVKKNGGYGMAKPCPNCETFLRKNGIKTVYYSNTDGGIEKMNCS